MRQAKVPEVAFQDAIEHNHCWGCGPNNPAGLRLKSKWHGDVAVAHFTPADHHTAAPTHVVNGGILATAVDCHAVCTAMADAYRQEERPLGEAPGIWYATGKLQLEYLRPTLIGRDLRITARVEARAGRRTTVRCVVEADGLATVEAVVVAVRVPHGWMEETR
ncbi:MAG: hotdog domain-containing protein [Trueperaceae bacterium]